MLKNDQQELELLEKKLKENNNTENIENNSENNEEKTDLAEINDEEFVE